jgi:hypothetical protein
VHKWSSYNASLVAAATAMHRVAQSSSCAKLNTSRGSVDFGVLSTLVISTSQNFHSSSRSRRGALLLRHLHSGWHTQLRHELAMQCSSFGE